MKRLLMIPLALLVVLTVNAQSNEGLSRKTFSFGPIMGFGHSWMTPTKYSEYSPSFNAGVFGIYSPTEHWGLGMDARYSIEGSKKDYAEGGIVKQEFHYLRVPIKLMYFFGQYGDDFRPKVTVGPSMGFLLGYKAPPYSSVDGFDVGLQGTVGFNYRITEGAWLNADVGCYHGLSDVILHTNNRESNRNITASLGVGFEL